LQKIGEKPPDWDDQVKRWYAVGRTRTDAAHSFAGASVQWQNEDMIVPQGGTEAFVNEALWINAQDDPDCWIEVGDFLENNKQNQNRRTYYWAENNEVDYFEYPVDNPPHPGVHQFQEYTIDRLGSEYKISIGGVLVGTSTQHGATQNIEAGLEANDQRVKTGPTSFRNFMFRPWGDRRWRAWDNRFKTVNDPAYWEWNWPTARNGIN
jgi:hypothetical protein